MGAEVEARRITITVEIVIEVTDPVGLEKAALIGIDEAEFGVVETGTTLAAVREAEAAEVRDDPVAAVAWLIDPERIVEGIPGVRTGAVTWEVSVGGPAGDLEDGDLEDGDLDFGLDDVDLAELSGLDITTEGDAGPNGLG